MDSKLGVEIVLKPNMVVLVGPISYWGGMFRP